MSRWDWFDDFRREAVRNGDDERVSLRAFMDRAFDVRESDPALALATLEEGSRRARALQEPWWVLLFEHWKVAVLVHFQRDFRHVLEPAVRNVLEARKPLYTGFPMRFWVFRDLLDAHAGIDVEGYAQRIRDMLAWLEGEVGEDLADRFGYWTFKVHFELELGDLDGACRAAEYCLELGGEGSDAYTVAHYLSFNYSNLCTIAHRRGDWEKLDEWAQVGEELARRSHNQAERAEFLMWQACHARRGREAQQAHRLHRTAVGLMRRLQIPPTPYYFDALCAYHGLGDDWTRVLQVRTRELKTISDRGQLAAECRCRVECCRLLKRLGLTLEHELTEARSAARKLLSPDRHLEELDRLEHGEG